MEKVLNNKQHLYVSEKAVHKTFNNPDEIRKFPLGRLELVNIGDVSVGRAIFEPGWKWSDSVKPIANTESCLAPHLQYHLSGTLRIIMDDGTVFDAKPGDVTMLPPGHDAYVVGDEAVVVVDFQGMLDYAKSKKE